MKRFIFCILSLVLMLPWSMSAGKAGVISIETRGSQMVLYVHDNGELSFYHYGSKFGLHGQDMQAVRYHSPTFDSFYTR